MKYKCKPCGCREFITKPNRYDIYISKGDVIAFSHSEYIDDKEAYYCRDCSEQLIIEDNNVKLNEILL